MDFKTKYKSLVDYLGGPTKAAEVLGVKQGTASGWLNGSHGMSHSTALIAESVTNGKFKAADLNQKAKELEERINNSAA